MRELTVQGANGTTTAEDRGKIQNEIDSLVNEVDRISGATQFNGKDLLDGTDGTADSSLSVTLQIGANNTQNLSFSISRTTQAELDLDTLTDINLATDTATEATDIAAAGANLDIIDTAIETVNTSRASLGAVSLAYTILVNAFPIPKKNTTTRIAAASFGLVQNSGLAPFALPSSARPRLNSCGEGCGRICG